MSRETFAPNEGPRDPLSFMLYGIVVTNTPYSQSITITTTPTPIPLSALYARKLLTLKNFSDQIIYIGGSDVTVANGYPMDPRDVFDRCIKDEVTLYGIVEADTADLRICEWS